MQRGNKSRQAGTEKDKVKIIIIASRMLVQNVVDYKDNRKVQQRCPRGRPTGQVGLGLDCCKLLWVGSGRVKISRNLLLLNKTCFTSLFIMHTSGTCYVYKAYIWM